MIRFLLFALFIEVPLGLSAQVFKSPQQLSQALRLLGSRGSHISVRSFATTPGGNDVWVVELGTGMRQMKPAVAVIGGLDEHAAVGQEVILGMANFLAVNSGVDSISRLLDNTTFYFFPNINPDGIEQSFATPANERLTNGLTTNDDRDLRVDEDPFEDLNMDGVITQFRFEDIAGSWRPHTADDRILIAAEPGYSGKRYSLFSEGVDNDKDSKFNEDGPGGVQVNRNFAFDPPSFQPGSGEHPAQAAEVRALMDFLYEHPNVFSVLAIGPTNNLLDPWKYDRGKAMQRVTSSVLEADARVMKWVSDRYRTDIKPPSSVTPQVRRGDVTQWAYYHYGRLSFSTPGWWFPGFDIPKDSAQAKKFKPNLDKNMDVDFVRWADKEKRDVFVPWSRVSHQDFPNKVVEVGGFRPFVRTTPPASDLPGLIQNHTRFMVTLAKASPRVSLELISKDQIAGDVFRLRMRLVNTGELPAVPEIALNNQWVRLPTISLQPGKLQLLSGNRLVKIPRLDGHQSIEYTWTIKGKGTLQVEAGCPQAGFSSQRIEF